MTSPPGSVRSRQKSVVVVEVGAEHLGVEPDLGSQAVLGDAVFGVGLQFVAGGVGARPVRALLERELIGERRNINGDTGIGVPVPRAAGSVACLDDQVVVQAGLVELDRGADAGESGTDDHAVIIGQPSRYSRLDHDGTGCFNPG